MRHHLLSVAAYLIIPDNAISCLIDMNAKTC
jgi:hypothetical protein